MMKNFSLAALMAATTISFSSAAFAAPDNAMPAMPEAAMAVVTVDQAQGMMDETMVVMKGNITQALGDDMYVFTDGTASINVEIDEEDWNGQTMNADAVVMISGEVDKNGDVVEIDVEEVMMPN